MLIITTREVEAISWPNERNIWQPVGKIAPGTVLKTVYETVCLNFKTNDYSALGQLCKYIRVYFNGNEVLIPKDAVYQRKIQ